MRRGGENMSDKLEKVLWKTSNAMHIFKAPKKQGELQDLNGWGALVLLSLALIIILIVGFIDGPVL